MEFLKALSSRLYAYAVKYPVAVVLTVLLVVGAIILSIFGKQVQLGGILGSLWGRKKQEDPNVKVLPPPNRVDDKGLPIPAGQTDDKGFIQVPTQIQIKDPGIFTDPNTIEINHPTKGTVVIPLPTGVKNTDVKQVVEINPGVYQLSNDDTGVDAGKILKDIENGK